MRNRNGLRRWWIMLNGGMSKEGKILSDTKQKTRNWTQRKLWIKIRVPAFYKRWKFSHSLLRKPPVLVTAFDETLILFRGHQPHWSLSLANNFPNLIPKLSRIFHVNLRQGYFGFAKMKSGASLNRSYLPRKDSNTADEECFTVSKRCKVMLRWMELRHWTVWESTN